MSATLGDLRDAIYTRFCLDKTTGSIYAGLSGRLYASRAPELRTWPYCVYSLIGGSQDWAQALTIDKVRMSFTTWTEGDPDGTAVLVLASKLAACFDWCALTFGSSTYSLLWMRPEPGGVLLPLEDNRSQYTQDYELAAQR